MNRAIMIMLMLTATVSFSFADVGERSAAQDAPKKVIKEVTLRTGGTDFVKGKVESVMLADILARTRSRITVADGAGNSSEFAVKALAVVYDSAGRILSLNEVKPGQEVQVNYIMRDGNIKEAVSIRILK